MTADRCLQRESLSKHRIISSLRKSSRQRAVVHQCRTANCS